MTAKTTVTAINLLEIGKQLTLTAKGLQQKVRDAGKPLSISASLLAGKLPELKVLGDLKIFQMRENEGGEFRINTLTLYKDGENCGVFTPDLDPVEDFEVLRYKTGNFGYTELKHKSGLEITASISWNDEHLIELEELEEDGLEGEGIPPISTLRELPRPETPLYSALLPIDKELVVVSNGKYSKEYQTPLVNIKLPDGEIQKDVLCNTALERLYKKHGDGMRFKIASKKQVERKKENTKVWLVEIIDCQLDLSDL